MRKFLVLAILVFASGPSWADFPCSDRSDACRHTPDVRPVPNMGELGQQTLDKRGWIRVAPRCPGSCSTPNRGRKQRSLG